MLRTALLILALLLLAGGLLMLRVLPGNAPPLLMFGGLLLVGTLLERWRYKPSLQAHEAKGQPTGERFVDPKTGEVTEVYYDPATGERSYVKVKGID